MVICFNGMLKILYKLNPADMKPFLANHVRCGCMENASTLADVPCQAYTFVATVPTRPMLRHGDHSKTLAEEAVEGSRRHHLCKARRCVPFDRGVVIKRVRVRGPTCKRERARGKNNKGTYISDFYKKTSKQRHRLGKAKEFFFFNALC